MGSAKQSRAVTFQYLQLAFDISSLLRMSDLRSNVINDDDQVAKEKLSSISTGSYGYGGKYGVEKDRMDKVSSAPDSAFFDV